MQNSRAGRAGRVQSHKFVFALSLEGQEYMICNQSLLRQITVMQCAIAGGRTKEANERSHVFVHQNGSNAGP